MKIRKSNRAAGQYFRSMSKREDITPLRALAVRVIDTAIRDAETVNLPKNRKFQPGVLTPNHVLEEEKMLLLEWVDSTEKGGYEWWAHLAGVSYDILDDGREFIRGLVNGREA